MESLSSDELRPLQEGDREALLGLLRKTGAFRPDEVEVAEELIDAGLERGEASGYLFRVAARGGAPTGYACYGPTPCTEGTFDLYWIAVSPEAQGRGVASRLLRSVEAELTARGGRLLVAETEEARGYEPAMTFYAARGFRKVARVPDFYRPGRAKLIYTKPLCRTGGL
ncbi:MAG: GNAT family N-acetyltransferase [Deltaproteobacteria bacterium]|nr:GNAT family N-acetyltransferase [Deltaproteobacteria bacterium]